MELETYPDREMMQLQLANIIFSDLSETLRRDGKATLSVPGGTTPGPVFDTLSGLDLDWANVAVVLNDERWVPESSDRSNTRLLRQRLLRGKASAATLIPLYADGFDTPERGSSCGKVNVYQKAAQALSDFIGARTVECDVSGADNHGRAVAQCKAGEDSLAEYMVESGWGRDWPRYSDRAYADEEKRAREAGAGIWGLDCPSDLWGNRNYD